MFVGIMFLAWIGTLPIHSAVGKQLPAIELEALWNADRPLGPEDVHDRVVVLHLWGPWSEESRRGYVEFEQLNQALQGVENVCLISVAFARDQLDREQLQQEVATFLADFSQPAPVYVDVSGQTSMQVALVMPYGSFGFPTTLVAEPGGKIVELIEGDLPEKMRAARGTDPRYAP